MGPKGEQCRRQIHFRISAKRKGMAKTTKVKGKFTRSKYGRVAGVGIRWLLFEHI
jgi:hypothetical protein